MQNQTPKNTNHHTNSDGLDHQQHCNNFQAPKPSPETCSFMVSVTSMHTQDTCFTPNSQFEYMSKFKIGGVKKTKKIKRKYEMKNKDATTSSNANEKPMEHVVYEFTEDLLLNSIDVSEKQKHTYFNYTKDHQVTIVRLEPTSNTSNNGKKGKRTVDSISDGEMVSLLHLTQQQACIVLGCSLSTLKRKFSQLKEKIGIDKWPHNYLEYRNYSFFEDFYPLSLKYILNNNDDL